MNNIITYFKNSVDSFSDKIAVSGAGEELTYNDVAKRSYAMSQALVGKKLKPVGIFLPKSTDAVCGVLASLMAGRIYCPLDVSAPKERIEKIISSLNECTIVTNSALLKKIEEYSIDLDLVNFINVDDIQRSSYEAIQKIWDNIEDVLSASIDTDPCYIIFTSGSTGTPKGVTISHRNVIDYIDWANSVYDVNSRDKIGSQAPLFFDNSTLDLYLTFSNAAEFHIIPEATFIFPKKLVDYLESEKISTIFWVPSLLVTIANFDLLKDIKLESLRNVFFAGEVMPAKQMKYWLLHHPEAHYSNLYGPTEITVDCTFYDVPKNWQGESLPIGVPCRNTDVLILDQDDKQAESGELCVRGSGVALGYWGDQDKTDSVFVQNPLNKAYRDIIYRTGDLVKVIDGLIYFIGRKDYQIKHNGYRIELGEIESIVSGLDSIDKCIAGYISEEKTLYMSIVSSKGVDEKQLRSSLLGKLPKYMIPSKFVFLDDFPLTANGKFNRLEIDKIVRDSIAND